MFNLGAMLLVCLTGAIAQVAPTPAPAPASPPASSEQAIALLDKLEARGQKLRNYQAQVKYTRTQGLLGDTQLRIGTITYQAADTAKARPARFAVRFTHLIADNVRQKRPRHFIFDGTWLAEIHPDSKQFIKRQVVAPGETFDPLKIGQGPFPLPLGQKRKDITDLFIASVIDSAPDDPKNTTHLHLVARTDLKSGRTATDYNTVDLWYDNDSLLPLKVKTVEGENEDEANVTLVELLKAQENALSDDALNEQFSTATPPAGSGWFVEIKPLKLEAPKPDEP